MIGAHAHVRTGRRSLREGNEDLSSEYHLVRRHAPAVAAALSGVAVTDSLPDSISDVLAGCVTCPIASRHAIRLASLASHLFCVTSRHAIASCHTPFASLLGASVCPHRLLAGAVAAALTTPLDVLVTYTTTQPSPPDGSSQPSALQVGARLVAEEGPLTLTRGIGWRSLYYAYTVGAFFGLYEYLRRALDGM